MSQAAMSNLIAALKTGAGLKDEFIYYMPFDDYKTFPDPFPRTAVAIKEVQESIRRYANPENPASYFSGTFTAGCLRRQDFPFPTWP
jgi:hypothetical protein